MEQRSEEWFKAREGKFTSSCASKLLGIKGLGETGLTYCMEKAWEILEGVNTEEGYESYDMHLGNEYEPYAFDDFNLKHSLDFISAERVAFVELNKNVGSSPDGLTSDNGILEIKVLKPINFAKIVRTSKIDEDRIQQMHHQMWCKGYGHAYNHNYLIYNGKPYSHTIRVERDEKIIDLLKSRTEEAIQIRDMYVDQLKANKQW